MQSTHEESTIPAASVAALELPERAHGVWRLPRPLRRVLQFGAALRARPGRVDDARYRQLIGEPAWVVARYLTAYDRQHHLSVYDWLVEHGAEDADLLQAALLHDVGKAAGVRIHAVHRAVHVLAARGGLSDVALRYAIGLRAGLRVLQMHPQRGANIARNAGASDRACWLIAHHHHDVSTVIGEPRDVAALCLLQEADHAVGA